MKAVREFVALDVEKAARSSQRPRLVSGDRGLFAVNLGKRYGSRPVVRGVSLALQRGEVVGLLGPNGAGKTTCFYMITGLLAPDEGRISLDGRDHHRLPMYRRARLGIGYLSQEPSVFRGLNVEDNIRAVLEVVEKSRSQAARVDPRGAARGVCHRALSGETPAVALSGGERRRVEIARALACNPQFIFLDEPFAGIDPIALSEIRGSGRASQGPGYRRPDHRS